MHTCTDTLNATVLTEATYATLTVRTQSGSTYTVVKRPGWVCVVCPDGVALTGDALYLVGGRLALRSDADDKTLLRTSTVVSTYVLEN